MKHDTANKIAVTLFLILGFKAIETIDQVVGFWWSLIPTIPVALVFSHVLDGWVKWHTIGKKK